MLGPVPTVHTRLFTCVFINVRSTTLTRSVLTFLLLLLSVEVHPSMKLGSDQIISIVAVQVKKNILVLLSQKHVTKDASFENGTNALGLQCFAYPLNFAL